MDFPQAVQAGGTAALIALLLAILVAGSRKAWVWGWQYDEVKADRDATKDLAERAADTAEKALGVSEQSVGMLNVMAEQIRGIQTELANRGRR